MGNASSSQIQQPPPSPPPSACPVDPSARTAWLEAAKDARNDNAPPLLASPAPSTSTPSPPPRLTKQRHLASDRVISSIPRSELSPTTSTPSPYSPPLPPSTAPQLPSSNWIYPSEQMFFEAMKRKNRSPQASDMATVVPIHNAVNERAWSEIKDWEARFAASQNQPCNGPMLRSFSGDSKKLSPRARWLGIWGYESPFDRHDWVIERCEGAAVEYVIDFYRGRGGGLSFYLDVRPKLNSWEGWRMRLGRLVGL